MRSEHPGQLLDRSWTAPGGPVQVWELGGCHDIWRAWGTRPGRPDGAQTPCIFLDALFLTTLLDLFVVVRLPANRLRVVGTVPPRAIMRLALTVAAANFLFNLLCSAARCLSLISLRSAEGLPNPFSGSKANMMSRSKSVALNLAHWGGDGK